ncbi:MAG: hypothetical protein Q8L15_14205 [Methylobacter sp.]|nr:hypothetical protein [Methylobacter sp.]
MKIYRGPKTKPLCSGDSIDDSHDLVDTIDLSKDSKAWEAKKIIKVNLTKKPDSERESVAHICLEEADVIALHQELLLSLRERASKKNDLEEALKKIINVRGGIFFPCNDQDIVNKNEQIQKLREQIKQIKEIAQSALDKL